ncbi:MAG: putative colanic acid biosynthesis acetyltransferase [Bryocella sp.]
MPKEVDYRVAENTPGQDAYTRPAFSLGNRARRATWNVAWLLLYRASLRPMHGWRAMLLRAFGATLGSNCHFYPKSKVWAPWNLTCEDHVAAGDGVEIYNPSPVYLASHVILSQDCYLCGATHEYNDAGFPLVSYRMRVGAYAWMCARSSVAPGVNVGDGAVLGLGAVATKDLDAWTVYAGNPAVAVKARVRHPDAPSGSRSGDTV